MKIKEGGYYRRRDGGVAGPMQPRADHWLSNGRIKFYADGKCLGISDCDLVAEVEVCDVLPFTLRAGAKYETVKPDGTAGPVVTLNESSKRGWHKSYCDEFPFVVEGDCYIYSVTKNGTLLNYNNDALWAGYHIVAEHHEPTPLEKLESLCRRIIDGKDEKLNAELDACIAAVKGAK